jgi:hypothetical protein
MDDKKYQTLSVDFANLSNFGIDSAIAFVARVVK